MKDCPTISCIMPVYNGDRYLEQSMSSVLEQSFQDFEFIVINDGSTDSSSQIIQQMRSLDSRIVVIDQQNKGVTEALNAGLAAARGMFIARMDADDVSMPDRFRLQHDFLVGNPDVVLVGGMSGSIDERGGRLPGTHATGNRHGTTDLLRFPPKVVTALHPLIMVRTDALRSSGGYNPGYEYAEDYDMFMRISRLGRIANLDEHILDYRTHGGNLSVNKLAAQEKHAAMAEVDNVNRQRARLNRRRLRLSASTFEAYVSIRILRRQSGLRRPSGPAVFLGVLSKLARGSRGSELYTTARLFLMLVFHGMQSGKALIST